MSFTARVSYSSSGLCRADNLQRRVGRGGERIGARLARLILIGPLPHFIRGHGIGPTIHAACVHASSQHTAFHFCAFILRPSLIVLTRKSEASPERRRMFNCFVGIPCQYNTRIYLY